MDKKIIIGSIVGLLLICSVSTFFIYSYMDSAGKEFFFNLFKKCERGQTIEISEQQGMIKKTQTYSFSGWQNNECTLSPAINIFKEGLENESAALELIDGFGTMMGGKECKYTKEETMTTYDIFAKEILVKKCGLKY